MDETKRKYLPNPLFAAGFCSRLFFWWLNPFFKTGYSKSLETDDLYEIAQEDSSEELCDTLHKEWEKEELKAKDGKKPSLLKAMIRTFGKKYSLYGIILFVEEGMKVVQPVFLGRLIRYFSPKSTMPTWEAYVYASAVGVCAMIITVVHHPYFFGVQRLGMRLRISSCSLIYKKALKLSNNALNKTTTGHIVNLLSNDVNRFDQCLLFLHFLWLGPIQALAVLVILWYEVGPVSLAGFGLLLLLIPAQTYMGKLFALLRRKVATQTDERVKIMSEVISAMRVIKMYCWEKMFGDLVHKVRKCELDHISRVNQIRAGTIAPFFASAKLIVYFTLLAYVLTGNRVNAEIAFTVVALINPVRLVLTLFVPFSIQMSSESRISINRIQAFLLNEELGKATSVIRSSERPKPPDCKVTVLNISASWDQESSGTTLSDISFEVKAGQLLAVIGPVGAGKSSLLSSILGELPLTKGTVKINGKVAYASQQPWVFSASIRQNVLFGQKYDASRYQMVLKASALTKDLEVMPDGDRTLVGEKGVSLSGGQKARISFARALYFDADIYLLDDPLSAVDPAVGRHLFDKCIKGVLRNKPIILVTHQLQYLKDADKIVILREGTVASIGTFEELRSEGVDFASLLQEDEDEKETEDDKKPDMGHTDFLKPNTLGHHNRLGLSPGTMRNDMLQRLKSEEQILSQSWTHHSILQAEDSHHVNHNEAVKESLLGAQSMENIHHHLRPRGSAVAKRLLNNKQANGHVVQSNLAASVERIADNVGSMWSLGSFSEDVQTDFVPQVQEEEKRSEGTVKSSVYFQYLYSGEGVCGIIMLIVSNLLAQGTFILGDWWLSYWSQREEERALSIEEQERFQDLGLNVTNITIQDYNVNNFIYIYTGITVSVFIFGLIRALWIFRVLISASRSLHNLMFKAVVRSPVLFFDTNPVGRILNRFSKDTGLMDELLPLTMFDFFQCGLMILGYVAVASVINPWVLIPTLPLCIVFVLVRRYYLETSRDVKRLEGTTRSPVFSHLSSSLIGLQTIRAYQVEEIFNMEFDRHQDLHTSTWFMFLSTNRWFGLRLDWLCTLFICAVAICSVFASDSLRGGDVGLMLTYAIGLMGLFQWGVRQSAECENHMTSVERIVEYTQLKPEAELDSSPDKKPSEDWPKHGIITAENAKFKYNENAPYVLKNLRFCIRAQEKVGICGRTGAGKSSLISMLFRLAEPEGTLLVDGVDISAIGLHDLRKKISIIPQDPVLFTGPLRKNLDPFNHHDDSTLWSALEEVQLKPVVTELTAQLDTEVSEGGTNFSVGQRQLICLARALLKNNKILVIDEATANVDPRTDALIQETIRHKFRDCTVLTIAHRLHTIMDSDRVMILQEGSVMEFDTPYELLQQGQGLFYDMVQQTGKSEAERLLEIAHQKHIKDGSSLDKSDCDDSNLPIRDKDTNNCVKSDQSEDGVAKTSQSEDIEVKTESSKTPLLEKKNSVET